MTETGYETLIVKTESTPVNVKSASHAMKLICTTCYAHQINHKEMKEFKQLQELANHFGIDTDDIIIFNNPIQGELEQGYSNVYKFNDKFH